MALKEAGALSEEEFAAANTKALAEPPTKVPVDANAPHSFIPSEVRQLVEQLRGPIGLTEAAALALCNLNREYSNQVAFAEAGGIPPLVAMARDGTDQQKMWAAAVLESLTVTHSGTVNTANQAAIAKADGIAPLVAIVRGGKEGPTEKAARALQRLAYENVDNQAAIAKAGGIDALVALARGGMAELAVGMLSNLASGQPATGVSNADNKEAIVKAGGIDALVALVRKGTTSAVRHADAGGAWLAKDAAYLLGTLARDSADSQVAIARAGGIDALVALYWLKEMFYTPEGPGYVRWKPGSLEADTALRALGCKRGFFVWTTPKCLREHIPAARAAAVPQLGGGGARKKAIEEAKQRERKQRR